MAQAPHKWHLVAKRCFLKLFLLSCILLTGISVAHFHANQLLNCELGSKDGSTTDHYQLLLSQHGNGLSIMWVEQARVIANRGFMHL